MAGRAGPEALEGDMKIAELFESYDFQLNWARQALLPYGGGEGPALAIEDGDELRVLVAAPIGIVDLRLSRSGPRSISRYAGSGQLWGWGDLGSIGLRSESHQPQPEFGHDNGGPCWSGPSNGSTSGRRRTTSRGCVG
jgi:hypothetical protein